MAKRKKAKWRLGRRLKIVEAIPGTRNPGQEKPILQEFMKMEMVECTPLPVDNRLTHTNLKDDFLEKLFRRYRPCGEKRHHHRYAHISAHGNGDALGLGVPENSTSLTTDDLRRYCDRESVYLYDQLITLSACGSLLGKFAETLMEKCRASVVIRPLNTVGFQESAMFFILFYFMASQRYICRPFSVRTPILEHSDEEDSGCGTLSPKKQELLTHVLISEYIDIFQRAKTSYLNIGGTGTFRLDYQVRKGNDIVERNHLF